MPILTTILMIALAALIGYDVGRALERRRWESEEEEEREPWGYVVDGGVCDGGEPEYESWE